MTIKYLVLSGGGAGGFAIYGALKYLSEKGSWNINDIKNIYSTSVGSLIAVLISLKYDWESLDDYIIKRPWDKVISLKPINLLDAWSKKGIFDINIIKEVLGILLTAKNLSESITLKEFYEYNEIEIHIYTVNINDIIPTKVDLSYKTHPDLELYKAIYMSSALPIIFAPICDNSNCYVDGGLLNNFPLNDCINDCINENNNSDDIMAFNSCITKRLIEINEESNIMNYLLGLIDGIRRLAATDTNQAEITNIVNCTSGKNTFNNWKDAIICESLREEMILEGEKFGEEFLNKEQNNDITKPSDI